MQRNFRLGLAAAAVGSLALALSGTVSASESSRATVHVIEHADTDAVFDGSDHPGSILTFHNPVYDKADKIKVGSDRGDCTRIEAPPAAGTWECRWTTFLPGGQITVEGPFDDTKDTVLSITGGTGVYSQARGQMKLISINNGAKYHFIFELNSGSQATN
jgi:allene oxide cyclase